MEFSIEYKFSKEELLHDERRRPFWNINLNAEWNLRCFCVCVRPRIPYSLEIHRKSKCGEVFVSGMLQISESGRSKKGQRRKFSKLLRSGHSCTRLNFLSLSNCKKSSELCLITGQICIKECPGRLIFDFHGNTERLKNILLPS
ncbi:hypothetical protein HNY73_020405 [Argiope bruennichi]|uniref:Uncharacterized protein n=1 Tax=Argiope bruennichi TaxID=94029 RepID=A0A8T0E979_ARGBR|nr:hypothetical protein HNY73_020405 [Argiope bruennichi]